MNGSHNYGIINGMLKDDVKQYYESNRLSFAKIAAQSETIFHQKVTVDMIKAWSQEDGGWKKADLSHRDRLLFLAERIYQKIEDEENLSIADLTKLTDTYTRLLEQIPAEDVGNNKPTLQAIIDVANTLDKRKNRASS